LLGQARVAGADPLVLSQLQQEFAYQTRLNDAREGRFSRLYAVSELTVKKQVAPAYPRGAQSKGKQGWVELEFTVTEEGEVRDAKARSSSASIFEGTAISAINRWRFEPVVEDGRPVPVRGVVKFTFRGDNG
jgi:periplasmic protein TonB